MKASSLSAMLWFRADRGNDETIAQALLAVRAAIAPLAAARVGHRYDEDRPYRTWMIDAGPIAITEFQTLVDRLREAVAASGLPVHVQAEPQLERFEWLDPTEAEQIGAQAEATPND